MVREFIWGFFDYFILCHGALTIPLENIIKQGVLYIFSAYRKMSVPWYGLLSSSFKLNHAFLETEGLEMSNYLLCIWNDFFYSWGSITRLWQRIGESEWYGKIMTNHFRLAIEAAIRIKNFVNFSRKHLCWGHLQA